MRLDEIFQALLEGKKIKKPFWKKEEYVYMDKKLNTIVEEKGTRWNYTYEDFDRVWELYEEEVKEPDSPPKENEEPMIGMGLTGYKNDGIKIDYSDGVKDLQQKNNELQKQVDELRIDVINLRIDVMRLAELITQIRE